VADRRRHPPDPDVGSGLRADAPAIDARRLFAVHGAVTGSVVALQGLSLRVERGEFLAVLGPSGAGKSTLMGCLAGTQRPLAGELHAFGARLHDAPARRVARWRAEHVAVIGQHYVRSLSPDLRVGDIVALPARLRGAPAQRARRRGAELLERAGLGDRTAARRAELSGGESQRVALCAALVTRPALLLGDEITGELDERSGAQVLELLRELAAERGTTIVLATHDAKAAAVADRAVTVRDGRITAELSAGGERSAVIDESGLVRLEPADLEAAGIAGKAWLETEPGALVLRGQGGAQPLERAPAELPRAEQRVAPKVVLRAARRVYGAGAAAVDALPPTDLAIEGAGLTTLVGPSGSGKTTLLHLIAGLERPTAGEVEIGGHDLGSLSRAALADFRREQLAFVPQAAALAGHLSARENVALAAQIRGRRDSQAVAAALEAVGLGELAGRRAAELSAGECQRVAVARALVAQPAVLLADEPTANLDQRNAIGVARLLAVAARRDGMLVLCATHDPSVIAEADRVIELG
jgi:ABC-type lipoprotein export system ATPase subunit